MLIKKLSILVIKNKFYGNKEDKKFQISIKKDKLDNKMLNLFNNYKYNLSVNNFNFNVNDNNSDPVNYNLVIWMIYTKGYSIQCKEILEIATVFI